MKAQNLKTACIKTLSKSEIYDQREFNGVTALKNILGNENKVIDTTFILRGSDVSCNASVTWYDARESHGTRSEFRLYYESNPVTELAVPGDNIVIGFDKNNKLNCILFKSNDEEHQGVIEQWTSLY
ncbi:MULTISPECIES: type II restriction endonuclease [Pantoea]|uniref:Type II restriction endonuclease n=1 Tax=Pantoea anthophila TaxID=470931 RepID=A0ABY2Z8N1_9GAMM|nr:MULTISPECIES: type II restriction endonuclease [Pantoea]MEB5707802.1 type II restriction endonuclease [Pantoea anthophila]MEB6518619.1 type II restriction endonuclease [Pantoea anthophila]TPV25790.1 type II restriction endonuclease [Pantoea anthophila]WIM53187.1 type II restriction endonuclease [Pantoea anthophila]